MESETVDSSVPDSVEAALLLIIGEPVTDDHKNLILVEITKGLRCWNAETGIDINEELAGIANRADSGEDGPNVIVTGPQQSESLCERTIHHRSERLAVEILVNPRQQILQQALQKFLIASCPYRHLVYAGHHFSGSGAWVLQDDAFSLESFSRVCKDSDVEYALKQQEGGKLCMFTNAQGQWKSSTISKLDLAKSIAVEFNPEERVENVHGIVQFTAYVSSFIHAKTLQELMRTSDVVGNIRFSKPTLYIFPACEGDSALFGISGFNLLVNGGYSRKSCFWDFTRHLDRIDAVLLTHLGTDNIFGINSVLKRKSIETVHPDIGYMFLNATDKITSFTDHDGEKNADLSLMISLAEEGSKITEFVRRLGPAPQPCVRLGTTQTLQPVNLYHKVGQGSLDMYILNPVSDSKELKDFYQQWNKQVAEFGSLQNVPIPNMMSICALLIWQPADPNESISRLFFPGNAPQHKIVEGLEKLKHLELLKRPTCTAKELQTKTATKKPGANARPVSARTAPKAAPVKESKAAPAKAPLSARPNKVSKEDENKKKVEEKTSTKTRAPSGTANKPAAGKQTNGTSKKSTGPPAKKTSPTEPKKSPTQASKSVTKTEKAPPPASEKSPVKEKSPELLLTTDTEEKHQPTIVDSQPPPSAFESSLIDISPQDVAKPIDDCLLPTQGESESASKDSESPDPLPDPNQYDAEVPKGESSLMYGSFHQDLQDDLMAPQNGENDEGSFNVLNGDGEVIEPVPLPEPVAYSPQECEFMPSTLSKDQSPIEDQGPESLFPSSSDVVPREEEHASSIEPTKEVPDEYSSSLIPESSDFGAGEQVNSLLQGRDDMILEDKAKSVSPATVESTLDEKHKSLSPEPTEVITDNEGKSLSPDLVDIVNEEKDLSVSPPPTFEVPDREEKSLSPELEESRELSSSPVEQNFPEQMPEVLERDVKSPSPELEERQEFVTSPVEQNLSEEQIPEVPDREGRSMSPDLQEERNEFAASQAEQDLSEEQTLDEPSNANKFDEDEKEEAIQQTDVTHDVSDEDDGEISPDEMDSQGDMNERRGVPNEEDDSEGTSPFAFENQGFKQDTVDFSQEDGTADKEATEPLESDTYPDSEPCVDAFEKDNDVRKENDVYSEKEGVEEKEHQSSIPEAFEKDETPDPVDQSKSEDASEGFQSISPVTEEDMHPFGAPDTASSNVTVPEASSYRGDEGFNSFIGIQQDTAEHLNGGSFDPFSITSDKSPVDMEEPRGQADGGPFSDPVPLEQASFNPFADFGAASSSSQPQDSSKTQEFDPFGSSCDDREVAQFDERKPFDPEAEWGKPMGLPSPPPPEGADSAAPVKHNGSPTKAKPTAAKSDPKRPDSARNAKLTDKKSTVNKNGKANGIDNKAKTGRLNVSKVETKPSPGKNRPASATAPSNEPKTKPAKRASTATGNRASPAAVKLPPLPPLTPFYMDLSYIPNHGNPAYSDIEFFKRVRARYYVLSSMSPNAHILNALLDGKETWDNKDLKVTIIPSYDNDTIRHWMVLNKDRLCDLNVDIAPSASRCTVQLQDHETNSSAYRLEF